MKTLICCSDKMRVYLVWTIALATCAVLADKIVLQQEGTIVSHDNFGTKLYPLNYKRTIEIKPPGVEKIKLIRQKFQLEGKWRQNECNFDYLEVDGEKYCDNDFPQELELDSPATLFFKSDQSLPNSGFRIDVIFVAQSNEKMSKCGLAPDLWKTKPLPRIIGGDVAKPGMIPWQVSLRNYGLHYCGGSIIGKKWILTAAHCICRWPSHVIIGEQNVFIPVEEHEQKIKVKSARNPGQEFLTSDIAVLELDGEIEYNSRVGPICLSKDQPRNHYACLVSGWGRTDPQRPDRVGTLRYATLNFYDYNECQSILDDKNYTAEVNEVCAGYEQGSKGSCFGDSGGPLVARHANGHFYQVGIVSHGSRLCARPGYPGVYSSVRFHFDWVCNITNNEAAGCGEQTGD